MLTTDLEILSIKYSFMGNVNVTFDVVIILVSFKIPVYVVLETPF